MPAADFFHVDCAVTLKRIYDFFALEVESFDAVRPEPNSPTGS